jgi:hypothetical protein
VNTDLYIVTTVFNPFGFKSRVRLYNHFKKHMEDSGAKLFTVEAAFGDRPFEATSPHNSMNLQLRTNQVIWHKERLINLGMKKLFHWVPSARYLGWYDADISFGNSNWVSETTHQLSHLSVVQPFSSAINLNSSGDPMWNCPSSMRSFIEGRGFHQTPALPVLNTYKGHPGLAWNITREAFEGVGGLYDKCVAGSADTVMSNSFKGDYSVYLPAPQSAPMIQSMKDWQEKADLYVRGRIGYTRGSVLRQWHGQSGNRDYDKRWSVMSYHQFDPTTDVVDDEQGMLAWAGNKPHLEDDIRLSLSGRNEDEV